MTVEGVFISAPSKHKEAAYEVVKFLTDKEPGKVLALEGRQSPANKSVYDDAKVANDPVIKAFRAQVEVAVPMPNLAEMTMVWSPATNVMNAVTKGSTQPKPALDNAQAQVMRDVSALRKR
jgi:arabinogalactan oligomer/maltooligosaccharide transport system substrate-binding protein